jgi:hypothetical protein
MRKRLKCVTVCVRATMPQSGKWLGCGMNGRGIVVQVQERTRPFTFCQLPDIWLPLRLQFNCYLELFRQKWPHRNFSHTLVISVEVKYWWKYTSTPWYDVIALHVKHGVNFICCSHSLSKRQVVRNCMVCTTHFNSCHSTGVGNLSAALRQTKIGGPYI